MCVCFCLCVFCCFCSVAQSCPTLCNPHGRQTAARKSFLSFTISWSLLKLMSTELVIPSNHLVLCCTLLLPSIFPIIRVFSNESALCIRSPKYWASASASVLLLQEGLLFPGPKWGSWLTLKNELSEETHVLRKQETLLGRGAQVESSRVREPRRTALPRVSQSWVLWWWD